MASRSVPRCHLHRVGRQFRYLAEHGLIAVVWFGAEPVEAILTARGADFLADDGGLSAILNVVTVRLDADSLKTLLIEQVKKSEGEPAAKAKLIEQIKSLSGKALETAVTETVKKGLSQAPRCSDLAREGFERADLTGTETKGGGGCTNGHF